jgi:signal transduction histidine kinase
MPVSQEQLLQSGLIKSKKEEIKEHSTLDLKSIQAILEQQRELPLKERDYTYMYFLLEQFALQQNTSLTKEDIRKDVASKFNTAWFSPKITAVFKLQDPDQLIFTETILESVLQTALKQMGAAVLQHTLTEATQDAKGVAITVTKKGVDLSGAERILYSDDAHVQQHTRIVTAIIKRVHAFSKHTLGASATEKLFSSAFHELKQKYGSLPAFQKAVRDLPEGVLDKERLELLTKEELENVSKRLRQVDTMKSEFSNIAAHELKTPLVPIIGYTGMMKEHPEKYGLNEKGRECIEIFSRNAQRLQNLVNDLLDISKLEAGEMKFDIEEVQLATVIEHTVNDLMPLAKEKKILLQSSVAQLPIVQGDKNKLYQVTSNLIKNAIKFTDQGSVTVKAQVLQDSLRVSITDTGTGLAQEDTTKIFGKFYQAQQASTRKTKGTGLGLAITKKIIEAHKGKVRAESQGKGKGSTFYFTLPLH